MLRVCLFILCLYGNYMRLPLFIVTLLSLLSAQTFADSSHQFSVNVGATQLDYEDQGEAKLYSLGGTAYFEAVKKSAALPYARTAFYSRVGSVSLSASKEKQKDLNRISAGRILESIDAKSYSAEVFLAKNNMPIWGLLNSRYLDESTYRFAGGLSPETDTDFIHSIAIGAFIGENLSVHGSYSKQEFATHGIGVSKLFNLEQYGFFETTINYSITESDTEIFISNNVVRNLDNKPSSRNGAIRFSYFPIPQTELSIAYQEFDYDNDIENRFYLVTLGHHFNNNIKVALNHTSKNAINIDNVGDYKATSLSLGYDF